MYILSVCVMYAKKYICGTVTCLYKQGLIIKSAMALLEHLKQVYHYYTTSL